MKYLRLLIVAAGCIAVPAIAQSAEKASVATAAPTTAPLAVQADAMVFSADGRRIGRIDHVRTVNGAPAIASVIFAGQFVNIPVSSLTAKDRGYVTSLKAADLIKR